MSEHAEPSPGSARIDHLAAQAKRAPEGDTDASAALWGAAFALPQWWFPTTEGDDPRPFLGVLAEGPALLAFTTGERAREWALANGFDEQRASRVISMAPENCLAFAERLVPSGVQVLVVDPGTSGFFAPLGNLRPMWDFLQRRGGTDG